MYNLIASKHKFIGTVIVYSYIERFLYFLCLTSVFNWLFSFDLFYFRVGGPLLWHFHDHLWSRILPHTSVSFFESFLLRFFLFSFSFISVHNPLYLGCNLNIAFSLCFSYHFSGLHRKKRYHLCCRFVDPLFVVG